MSLLSNDLKKFLGKGNGARGPGKELVTNKYNSLLYSSSFVATTPYLMSFV